MGEQPPGQGDGLGAVGGISDHLGDGLVAE